MSTKMEIKIKNPRPVSSRSSEQGKTKDQKQDKKQSIGKKAQCKAARADKKQCTRTVCNDSELCYWHIDHLTYGLYISDTKPKITRGKSGKPGIVKQANSPEAINDVGTVAVTVTDGIQQPPTAEPPKPKTRGRKRKQAIDPRFNDPVYITMWPEICEGICVLVDRNDNVYSYDNGPDITFLGTKLLTGKIDRTAGPRSGF